MQYQQNLNRGIAPILVHFLLLEEVVVFECGGMLGAVESEIYPLCEVLVVNIGYWKNVDKMFRSTQPLWLKYMQVTLSQKYNGYFVVWLFIEKHIGNIGNDT